MNREIERYRRSEGMDPYALSPQRKTVQERLEDGSQKTVDSFFAGLTQIRMRQPGSVPFFLWEKKMLTNRGIPKDAWKKTETWQTLLQPDQEGKKSKDLFDLYIEEQQNDLLPQRLFDQMIHQATNEPHRRDIVTLNAYTKGLLREFAYKTDLKRLAIFLNKGSLPAVAQTPNFIEQAALAVEAYETGTINAKLNLEGKFGNPLGRFGEPFALVMRAHLMTFQPTLGESPPLTLEQIDMLSNRIFKTSLEMFLTKQKTREMKAGVAGLVTAHLGHIAASAVTSVPQLLVSIGESAIPAVWGISAYRKIKAMNQDDLLAIALDEKQKAFLDIVNTKYKQLISQRGGRGVAVDLSDAKIMEALEALTLDLDYYTVGTNTPIERLPWQSLLTAVGVEEAAKVAFFHDSTDFSSASILITASIIQSALTTVADRFKLARSEVIHQTEIVRLQILLDAIDKQTTMNVPTLAEASRAREKRGLPEITTREEFLRASRSYPVKIRQIDTGSKREVLLRRPTQLAEGTVSFVRGQSGSGKTTFVDALLMEICRLDEMVVTKGADFTQVAPELLGKVFGRNTEIPGLTIAEQIRDFVLDPELNDFQLFLKGLQRPDLVAVYDYLCGGIDVNPVNKVLLNRALTLEMFRRTDGYDTHPVIREEQLDKKVFSMIDLLLSKSPNDKGERKRLLDLWVKNPSYGYGVSDNYTPDHLASILLTLGLFDFTQGAFNQIKHPKDAAAYAKKVPSRGMSAGEQSVWNILTPLAREMPFTVLDEPTAHLGTTSVQEIFRRGDEDKADVSYLGVATIIQSHLRRHPTDVLLLVLHDTVLLDVLHAMSTLRTQIKRGDRLVDKVFYPANDSPPNKTIFEVKQLR